jgi:hypothetical protein
LTALGCGKAATVTDGLAILAAWVVFLVLLAVLGFVVLRGDRR